jgi:hypothetical protein
MALRAAVLRLAVSQLAPPSTAANFARGREREPPERKRAFHPLQSCASHARLEFGTPPTLSLTSRVEPPHSRRAALKHSRASPFPHTQTRGRLRYAVLSLRQGACSLHRSTAFQRCPTPAFAPEAANPSFNLTFSGWLRQPPNAS